MGGISHPHRYGGESDHRVKLYECEDETAL